jgi:uncharacterized protein
MMDHDLESRGFSNRCRLFPLPNVVLFPHVVLPLHIFELRYRQMTEDALADDRLVTIVQICPATTGELWTEPVPLEEVGCLGKIIQHERLPDGRFNLLLLGRERVRLRREIPGDKLYRIAEVEVLEDIELTEPEEPLRSELISLFREVFEKRHLVNPDLAGLLKTSVPLGVLTDILAHALNLPPSLKQCLLAETRVEKRVETVGSILRQVVAVEEQDRPFPPPFSTN